MDEPPVVDDAARRISLFCVGLAAAALAIFVGWVAFALSATDFYASGWRGWADARIRLAGSPELTVVVGLSAVFAGLGVVLAGRAIVGHRSNNCT